MAADTALQETAKNSGLALFAVEIIALLLTGFYIWFKRMSIPHCGSRCDFAGLDLTTNLFIAFGVIVLIASIALFAWRRRKDASSWWAPALGSVLILLGGLVASYFSDVALLFIN